MTHSYVRHELAYLICSSLRQREGERERGIGGGREREREGE